jgi:AhpC/TSA family
MTVLIRAFLLLLASTAHSETLAIDLDGHPIQQLAPAGSRAVVLFFAASDCPISNRYVPEIKRLAAEFGPHAVHFWFVYPNPGDDASVVRTHNRQFSITTDTALDTKQTLVQFAHVAFTPEAAVFVPDGGRLSEVYHGRIDDRYLTLGKERPAATRHDLEEAIRAVLVNRPVPQPGGSPTGCSILPIRP